MYPDILGKNRMILAPQALLQHHGVLPVLGCQLTQQNLGCAEVLMVLAPFSTPWTLGIQTWQAGKSTMKNGQNMGHIWQCVKTLYSW